MATARRPPVIGLTVPRTGNTELQRFCEHLIALVSGLDGDIRTISGEVSRMVGGGGTGTGTEDGTTRVPGIPDAPELAVPPVPTGLEVSCGLGSCITSWINPFRWYKNHALTRVYRNTVEQFDTAAEIGAVDWLLHVDEDVEDNTDYWYWIRFESDTAVLGPPSAAAMGRTAPNPETVYAEIVADLERSPLAAALTSQVGPSVITEEIRRLAGVFAVLTSDVGRNVQEQITTLESSTGDSRLGPAPNTFAAATEALAEAARDAQANRDATWFDAYKGDPNNTILLRWQ